MLRGQLNVIYSTITIQITAGILQNPAIFSFCDLALMEHCFVIVSKKHIINNFLYNKQPRLCFNLTCLQQVIPFHAENLKNSHVRIY